MTAISPAPSSKDSSTTSPSSYYLPLPPELRNRILSLALTGGHVYLRASSSSPKLSHKPTTVNSSFKSTPSVNLLATCRQAYDEGRVMYYNDNVFHLPPGPWEEIQGVLAKIKPENLSMMKHVVLRLSLLDLTPSVLREADKAASSALSVSSSCSRSSHLGHALIDLWWDKLSHTRSKLNELNEARVLLSPANTHGDEASILIAHWVGTSAATIRNPSAIDTRLFNMDTHFVDPSIHIIFPTMGIQAYMILSQKIEDLGWEKFQSWLNPATISMLEEEGSRLPISQWSAAYWREIDVEMIAAREKVEV